MAEGTLHLAARLGINLLALRAALRAGVPRLLKRDMAIPRNALACRCRAGALCGRYWRRLRLSFNRQRIVAREPVHFAVGFHQFEGELALLGLRRLHVDLARMLHLIAAAELLGGTH